MIEVYTLPRFNESEYNLEIYYREWYQLASRLHRTINQHVFCGYLAVL